MIWNYVKDASRNDVRIIIRIHPSPGNFDSDHNLWIHPIPGIGYGSPTSHRPADDVADEIIAIHNYNRQHEVREWGFEPANEPNIEWYTFDQPVEPSDLQAREDMNEYFIAIYNEVKRRNRDIRVLTPPMAQAAFAEMKNINAVDPSRPPTEWCPEMRPKDNRSTGYGVMREYYTDYNDGIDWHNYWRLGFEKSGDCSIGAQHVSYFFPRWMKDLLESGSKSGESGGKSGMITEADLFSYEDDPSRPPGYQDRHQPLHDKDERGGWPAANSLRKFFTKEPRARAIVAWTLNDWSATPESHSPNPEHDWHEAYGWDDRTGHYLRPWFAQWWLNHERWAPPVYLPDVRSDDAGWDTQILIQNASDWPHVDVTVDLFHEDGRHAGQYTCASMKRGETCGVNPTNTGFSGWAAVSGNRNVAVVALTRQGDQLTAYNGILPDGVDIGDPGWKQAGTRLYAPVIKRHLNGRSSRIYVLNIGARPTTVYVEYYRVGHVGPVGLDGFDLEPGERGLFLADLTFIKEDLVPHAAFSTWSQVEGFKGSAKATSSGQPIVGAVNYVNNATSGDTGASFNAVNR